MTHLLTSGFSSGGILAATLPSSLRQDVRTPARLEEPDAFFMAEALRVAMLNVGMSSPNPSVGCVFVKDGVVVAKGATLAYGDLHAERQAIASVPSGMLQGSTLYVTLEPCSHYGKQPPCTEAILKAGIKRCVIGTRDPNPLVYGKGLEQLRAGGVEITVGVLNYECLAWHYPFALSLRTGKMVVAAKWAQTIDGHLADDNGQSKWLSGPASRAYAHFLRQKYDAIMVGAGTVIHDRPTLTARNCVEPINRQPVRLIFDPQGKMVQLKEQELASLRETTFSAVAPLVYGVSDTAWRNASTKHKQFIQDCAEVITCDVIRPLESFLDQIGARTFNGRPLQSLLVEGGATLINEMLRQNRIDLFHVFIVPAFLAGDQFRIGRHHDPELRQRQGKISSRDMARLRLLATQSIGNDVLMEFVPPDRFAWVYAETES